MQNKLTHKSATHAATKAISPRARSPEIKQPATIYAVPTLRASAEQIARTRLGIPASDIIEVAKMIGMPRDKFYACVGLPKSTIEKNISQQSPLSTAHGDRLYRVNRVFSRTLEVLEDEEAAKLWVQQSNRSLGGESPLSLLDTEAGYELVMDTLGRIEYGVVA
ncbi:type II RES/Xre toxin-antitoxin system antitoxin [Solimicrobium silvestre]|uniref:Putative toxin-antitoxin system antitoxin component, TIGR02293 family n=1 Tax=Solimicrobium silvestre TaxID=2099400 RepID=A0A2S9H1E7_9BURK|nr:antitoxin Xre/MbcA/ParS toxin-binding domain-containing protein [Solimicrobium silvestre]PRC93788.1 putative toxin-antitoxin system antitoxin component, TIGR02293 family [Solimicrobium silvestre]